MCGPPSGSHARKGQQPGGTPPTDQPWRREGPVGLSPRVADLRFFACLREPSRRRGAISIRHAPTLALSRWRTTPGLYSSIRFELGRGGCFRVDNGSDGNLSDAECALNAAQNKAVYYVHSVLLPPRQPSPMRSRASASHCTTSRPPRCYRVSRYMICPPFPPARRHTRRDAGGEVTSGGP